MLRSKSIKKFILLSLFIALPVQTMTMPSWSSFLSIKKNLEELFSGVSIADISKIFKKHKTAIAISLGGCVAMLYYKSRNRRSKKKEKKLKEGSKSFHEVGRNVLQFNCGKLTHDYVKGLFSQNTPLKDLIKLFNSYSPEEREEFAKSASDSSDSATEDEIRAFEYIQNGYKYLANILHGDLDKIPGYNQVACMSDAECAKLQSRGRVDEKKEIRQNYLSSIVAVVWCLYDCALQTGDAFTQGVFNEQNKNLYDIFI